MKSLVIVESPTKAKTIGRFLGAGFTVRSSYGHVRDLPKTKLGVDVEHNFEPKYMVPAKAKKVIAELKEYVKDADRVILATDEDREGEAIAWHLEQTLKLGENSDKYVQRIVFHEITKNAIIKALENPRELDLNLVDAQQARRVLDRLVGYELSPFLWKKVKPGLSAGRVQSVAVRLVVEREREIQKFIKEEYWSIEADLHKAAQAEDHRVFRARLTKIDDTPVGKMDIGKEEAAGKIVKDLEGASYTVSEVSHKEVNRSPSPPFTTSTLQQEASRKFGLSAKQTMMVAQQLYEGIAIGEHGETGLITYMRTDSLNIAQSALEQAQEIIKSHFGPEYGLKEARKFSNKSKGAQEAHEAIRPTDLSRTPDSIKSHLDKNQYRIYDLIWKRTIASQMQAALFDHTAVDIQAGTRHTFRANGQVIKFDGFIRAYTEGKDDEESGSAGEIEGQLPELEAKEKLALEQLLPLQHFTEPPARYTDATLIKALEAHGIGRPSTYAPILTTIQDRGYVEKIEKRYQPSEIGIIVNDMLVENFPQIVDINFTSHVEESFDDIAEGKLKWQPVIKEFYGPFHENLKEKEASVEKHIEVSTTPCPHCGKMMIIKFGRMGKFLACPEPGVKVTQPMPEEIAEKEALAEKTKGEMCPLCGVAMEVKRGRFGYFLGCSRYPECKGIAKIQNKTGFKCPHCQTGDIVERKSRGRGKTFYACNRFPDCTFVMSNKPTSETELHEALQKWQDNPPKTKKTYTRKKKKEETE